ncbi:VOC family protein [Arthrobacter sp. NPDC056727]|uniref:VOC family protein n=1 Tax=Arthrobacter sp. NPDC056727 TaxID=3345927 RepID=UPI00366B0340
MSDGVRVAIESVLFVGGESGATRAFFNLVMRRQGSGSDQQVLFVPAVGSAIPDSGAWVPCFGSSDKTALTRQVLDFGADLISTLDVDGRELRLFMAPDQGLFALADLIDRGPRARILGAVAFIDLYTPLAEKAANYYANALSCRVIHETIPTPGDYRFLVWGDEPVAGVVDMLDVLPAAVPPHWIPYWRVLDLEAEVARLSDLGARVRVPVTDSALGPFALLADPFGVTFGLQTPASDNLLVEHGKSK